MKRTNLVLDEKLLQRAMAVYGAKTYSEAVNKALFEAIQLEEIRGISEWIGSGVWNGNLTQMREGKPRITKKKQT